jgi:predicted XRE-type DNA-binding protein
MMQYSYGILPRLLGPGGSALKTMPRFLTSPVSDDCEIGKRSLILLRRGMTGKDLEAFRKSLKLSQAELAEKLGVDRMTVWRFENGKSSSRLIQSLVDQVLARGGFQTPPVKKPRKKKK